MSTFLKTINQFNQQNASIFGGVILEDSSSGNRMSFQHYVNAIWQETFLTGSGLSPIEVSFLEDLFDALPEDYVKSTYIIGNAWGWSSIVLANLSQSKVVAIDAALGGTKSLKGIELTKQVALKNGLDVTVEVAISPQDNADVIKRNFYDSTVDLVLIDAIHTDEAQLSDFYSVLTHTSNRTIFIFHDVLSHNLDASFQRISALMQNHKSIVFHRTTSGIGGLFPVDLDCLSPLFKAYSEDESAISFMLQKLGESRVKSRSPLLKLLYRIKQILESPVRN